MKTKPRITVIKPSKGLVGVDWRELWQYRELFFTFVERDIRVRYKQTLIGGAWAIIQPLTTMIVFSFFFGKLAKIPSEGVPYPIFSYAGILLWSYFNTAINSASLSLVANSSVISKVYFPRIIIPLAASLTPLVDYVVASTILLILMIYYQIPFSVGLLGLPIILMITWFLSSAISFWFSAINVVHRDMKFLLTFIMSLWIYATPVIYPASVAERFRLILLLNPMTGLIETHRALVLGRQVPWLELIVSIILSALIGITGILFFRKVERTFADVI